MSNQIIENESVMSVREFSKENNLDYRTFISVVRATKLKPYINKSGKYVFYREADLFAVKNVYDELPELLKKEKKRIFQD